MLLSLALITACVGSKSSVAQAATSSVDKFIVDAGNGNTQGVRDFLARGGDVNARHSSAGVTALMSAAYNNRAGVVSYLLRKGARIEDRAYDSFGKTSLMYATIIIDAMGHLRDPETGLQNPDEPYGSIYNSQESLEILIKAGANLNIQNKQGQTALVYAIEEHQKFNKDIVERAVKVLLEAGADPNIEDNNGDSALDIASLKGMVWIARLLKQHGAK